MVALEQTRKSQPKKLIVLLAALSAIAPFAIDTYLPAIPEMAAYFGVGIAQIQITIGIFLGGMAVGQVVGGPISDHYGRKACSLVGLVGFLVASLLIALSDSADGLVMWRAVQAFFGGMAIVNSYAVARDLAFGREGAKMMSMISMVMMFAPLVAPMVGVVILQFGQWPLIFFFLALYAVLIVTALIYWLPETNQAVIERRSEKRKESIRVRKIIQDYKQVLSHRSAMGYLLSCAFGVAIMFVFLNNAPFLYIEMLSIPRDLFPFAFGANVILIILSNAVNARLLNFLGPRIILLFGLSLQAAAVLALVALSLLDMHSLYLTIPLIMIVVGVLGFIGANAMAGCLVYFPETGGTANAVSGTATFLFGGLVGGITAFFFDGTALPITLTMLGCSILAFGSVLMQDPMPED